MNARSGIDLGRLAFARLRSASITTTLIRDEDGFPYSVVAPDEMKGDLYLNPLLRIAARVRASAPVAIPLSPPRVFRGKRTASDF